MCMRSIVLSTVMVHTALCTGLWCWLTSNAPPRRVPTRASPHRASQHEKKGCARSTLVRAEAAR
eukprot:1315571-Alexandrium_andersonii.AAC.1